MAGGGRISRFSRSLALGAAVATARFTVTALLIVAASVLANLAVADVYPIQQDDLEWLFGALLAATAASLAMRLAAESHGWRPALQVVMPALAALAAGLVVWNATALSVLAPPLISAMLLAVPLAPYLARPDDKRFWTFTLWATVGSTLAFLAVLLFVLGVSAILEMIRYLFGIGLESDAYEHIYATALTLVGPLFALGRIPTDFDETAPEAGGDRLAAGVRFLFDWVGAPLALATAVVLHLYAAKITLFGELPKNEIGWIVTFYAVLVLSFRVAIDPFIADGAVTTRMFGKVWALMLAIPIALLGYAAGLRIAGEGFTLERYYLALGALAAALVVVVQALPRLRGDIRLMAGLPLALLALSSVGPWGVVETVARSQTTLISLQLSEGMPVDDDRRNALRSRIDALKDVDEVERLMPLLSDAQRTEIAKRLPDRSDLASAAIDVLGVGYGAQAVPTDTITIFASNRIVPVDVQDYDIAVPWQSIYQRDGGNAGENDPSADTEDFLTYLSGPTLVVRYGGVEDQFSLLGHGQGLKVAGTNGPDVTAPAILDLKSDEGRRVRLSVSWASIGMKTDYPTALTALILLKRDEWASPR